MHDADPEFPPRLTGHDVRGGVCPFLSACEGAAAGRYSAGDVVWSRATEKADFAIVLEPEVALERAVEMLMLLMVASGDCIGALAPPQVGSSFRWPGELLVNGASAGHLRIAAGPLGDADTVPDWLVVGANLRMHRGSGDPEPGYRPDMTWLGEEGCGALSRSHLIASLSRHFLTWLLTWEAEGFGPVHASWWSRAEDRDQDIQINLNGRVYSGRALGLDDHGGLLLKSEAGTVELSLNDVLERPQPVQEASA